MRKFKLIIIFLMFLSACYFVYSYKHDNNNDKTSSIMKEQEEFKGVFISYIDYSPYLKGKSIEEQKTNIDLMVKNIKEFGFNTILLQVRPFGDAIYKSNIYKPSTTIVETEDSPLELDILSYFIDISHKNNINLHAWINPYRIRSTNNINTISTTSKYYEWLNTNNIEISDNGIYLNPASKEVIEFCLKGLDELVKNYNVDGILYDDYFYPSETIDIDNYNKYKGNGGKLTIEEYRIDNINKLIRQTYITIKSNNKNIEFGISPSGNIENNLNKEYLDIKTILEEGLYLDYVMPQLYYGFFNQIKPFQETISEWDNLIKNNIKLYPALSIYKSGVIDEYAGSGKNEWIDNDDILKKQIIISRNKNNYEGFSIFRYDFLFNEEKQNDIMTGEISNIKAIMVAE